MLKARETFHVDDRTVEAGSYVADHDEVVAGREHLFDKLADAASDATEASEAFAEVVAKLEAVTAERDELRQALEVATKPVDLEKPDAGKRGPKG